MDPQENEKRDKKKEIVKTIADFLPEWGKLKYEEVKLDRMAGITNETYKVSHPAMEGALIYRQFGDASDNIFLDRETEEYVYQFISDSKAGPKVFGMTDDIRIEEFIVSKVLKTREMLTSPFVENIAYALRKFHKISPKKEVVDRKSLFSHIFFDTNSLILEKCLKKMKKPIFTQEESKILKQLEKWVSKQQVQFLKKAAEPLEACKLVFSHNDLLAGNVLIREGDGKIIFIDYEYSCYNYRAYDIANYFNECIYDYEVTEAPYFRVLKLTEEQERMKQRFIKCYAMAHEKGFDVYQEKLATQTDLNEEDRKVYEEVKSNLMVAEMLSHVMWGFWAIIVSKNPAINFDYISFARVRHNFYQELKQQYLKGLKEKGT